MGTLHGRCGAIRSSANPPGPVSGGAGQPGTIANDLDEVIDRATGGLRRLAGKTVLVAGGAGFLPSYLVDSLAHANEQLLEQPCRILSVDNLSTGVAGRLEHLSGRDDVVFLERDLVKGVELDERVDYVVHAASIASPSWYRQRPLETIDVNVVGTRRLLELAREQEVEGFVYLSSSEIYGDPPPDRVPTTEDYWGHVSSTGPRSCYDESKRLAESLCMTYFRLYGVPVKLIRPFNVYGPRLRLDDGRVIPDFLSDALNGRPITLYSDGRVTRSFCYITDFVTALILLLVAAVAGEAYNVGNDREVTIRDVAETVAKLSRDGAGIRFASSDDPDYLTDNPNRRSPDLRKTKATVDWSPIVGLEEGLRRTYDSYREQEGR
jgi:dTDP-glucose 4,6-dehydratase/UDP-glucuronate decarboxylase